MTDSSINQILVGQHKIGIIGLKTALKSIHKKYENCSDDVISEKLVQLLAKKNYISQNAKDKYRLAFLNEYKKFAGLPIHNVESDWLEIKILGGGCNICNSLENSVMEVLSELSLPADVEHITDKDRIRQYQVLDGPALVINREVVANGVVPLKQEIKSLLEKFAVHPVETEKITKPIHIFKNITFSETQPSETLIDYRPGQIASRTFVQNSSVTITLFAMDKGERINTHTAPGDAMLQVLDGQARVTIDHKQMIVECDQTIVMPADIPHSVEALERTKMFLILVKK